MAVFKCKMCGGDLTIEAGVSVCVCDYCGTKQTVPSLDDDKKTSLYNRANILRFKNEFDKAAGVYESIVAEFPDEAEAYWGLVLCKFGVEYVDDADGTKIHTCHRTLPVSIMEDSDFDMACANADISAKSVYRDEAKAIDAIQKKILEIAATEEPYDIFICYKETDDITGSRSEDSGIAQDIFTELTKEGYNVFYARNSLREVAGTDYEPYIYAALSSAKVMLAIGTKHEYYDAVWVKNEWSRFISMMHSDKSKALIPCFKNMDAYDMPKEFKNMQALDMADMMFYSNLEISIKKILPLESKTDAIESKDANSGATATVDSLLKRAYLFLDEGDWNNARGYCEKVLDIDPENAKAYLCKLMAIYSVKKQEQLGELYCEFNNNVNFQRAYSFGDEALKKSLSEYAESARKNSIYSSAKNKMYGEEIVPYEEAIKIFETIPGWLDADVQIDICRRKIDAIKKAEAEKEAEEKRKLEEARIAEEVKKENIKKNNRKSRIRFIAYVMVIVFVILLFTKILPRMKFSDITAVYAGELLTVGLKSDGTVVAVGDNDHGQRDVSEWTDIVAISAWYDYTIGLKSDGTVVATDYDDDHYHGQCNVNDWTDIVAISAGSDHAVGLKSDGTVVATEYIGDSDDYCGQCDVSGWTDIVAVSAGSEHTIGLKSDGTVVATKYFGDKFYYGQCDVSDWTDIVAISTSYNHTVGLKEDGTVVAVGNNDDGKCDVSQWTDIVAISAGGEHTVGLKSDGTVVAVGENYQEQCDISEWKDIVEISAGHDHTVGLKEDGTVVAVGDNDYLQCWVGSKK